MRRSRSASIGAAAVGLGLLIGLFPLVSVWRLSGEVLEQLPEFAAATAKDDRHRLALADGDFVLATRTYREASVPEIESALAAAGFDGSSADGKLVLAKSCCGTYDAVWVQVNEAVDGNTVATLTVADSDLQMTWVSFAIFGSALVLFGVMVLKGSLRRSTEDPSSAEFVHEPV